MVFYPIDMEKMQSEDENLVVQGRGGSGGVVVVTVAGSNSTLGTKK